MIPVSLLLAKAVASEKMRKLLTMRIDVIMILIIVPFLVACAYKLHVNV